MNWDLPFQRPWMKCGGVCDKLVEAGIQPFSFPDKKAVRISQQFDRMLIGCVDHDFYSKCDEQINGSSNIKDDPNIRKYAETILKLREYANPGFLLDMMINLLTKNLLRENLLCTLMVPGQCNHTFETMNPDLISTVPLFPRVTTDDFWTVVLLILLILFLLTAHRTAGMHESASLISLYVKILHREFSDGDKNPTLIQGVKYNVPQLKEINDYINEGRFASFFSKYLATGFKKQPGCICTGPDLR